jgi:hypothetical protein
MAKRQTKASKPVLATNVANAPSPFLKLPLEIRETIYRMLLTTCYTYTETLQGKITRSGNRQTLAKTTSPVSIGRFNLSPTILQVSKQISSEATRILYRANEFIIVKIEPTPSLGFIDIPAEYEYDDFWQDLQSRHLEAFRNFSEFRMLPQGKVPNPALKATIATLSGSQECTESWLTLIITPEVMPRFFSALWNYSRHTGGLRDCFLALDFCNRNPSRHGFLNEKILKIWDQMCGFGELRLTGNTDEVIGIHLKQHMASGPSVDNIVSYMEMFQSIAENSYSSNDFATAYLYWYYLQRYWAHHLELERHAISSPFFSQPPQTRLGEALNITAYKVGVAAFGILKIWLHFRNYNLALKIAKSPDIGLKKNGIFSWGFGQYTCISPILRAKFAFCSALALIAQGLYEDGNGFIRQGIYLIRGHSDLYARRKYDDVFNEICKAIDNELIERESRWRCGRQEKVGPKKEGGADWQLRTGCLPFWDWLEILELKGAPECWAQDV